MSTMGGRNNNKKKSKQTAKIHFISDAWKSKATQKKRKRGIHLHIWVYRSIYPLTWEQATAQENLPGPKKPTSSSSPAITERTAPPDFSTLTPTVHHSTQLSRDTHVISTSGTFLHAVSTVNKSSLSSSVLGPKQISKRIKGQKVLLSAIIRFAGNHRYLQLKSGNRCSRYHTLIAEQRILQHVTEMWWHLFTNRKQKPLSNGTLSSTPKN